MGKTKIIIGLMGKPGSGKDTVVGLITELCPDQSVANLRFSDPLKEFLTPYGLKPDRDNLSLMARLLVEIVGPDALADAIRRKIAKTASDIICLNGVRWAADVKMLKSVGGQLIFIDTKPEIRYKRVTARGEKPGETDLTFEQFLAQEQTKNDLSMDTLREQAEVVITNNGSLADCKNQLRAWLKTKTLSAK